MRIKRKVRRINTTFGDLVVAITDMARTFTDNERDAYRLAGCVLNHALQPVPVLPRPMKSVRRRLSYC